MKKRFILSVLAALVSAGSVQATLYSSTGPAISILDGSPVGISSTITVNDSYRFEDGSLDVHLNIAGGFNGDLYGYLVHTDELGNTKMAVLLNRVGLGTDDNIITTLFGFRDPGMNVTLDTANSTGIQEHNGEGALVTGTYAPADSIALDNFTGMSAKGTWTLFLADLSGGGTARLQDWGFDITLTEPVPEPITWALLIFGASACALKFLRRRITPAITCR